MTEVTTAESNVGDVKQSRRGGDEQARPGAGVRQAADKRQQNTKKKPGDGEPTVPNEETTKDAIKAAQASKGAYLSVISELAALRSCIAQSAKWSWANKPGITEDLDTAEKALTSAINTNGFVSELFGTPMKSMKMKFKDSLESEAAKVPNLVQKQIEELHSEVKNLHAMHHARLARSR